MNGEKWKKVWDRYKFVALVVALGVGLLLFPFGNGLSSDRASEQAVSSADPEESRTELETEMEQILSRISGVGELHLMLTVESGAEQRLAQDTELSYSGATAAPDDYTRRSETVVVSGGSGDAPVVTATGAPVYRGALVVCGGGDSPEVRLAVTQAVAALTGLSTERITVMKCQ